MKASRICRDCANQWVGEHDCPLCKSQKTQMVKVVTKEK